MKVTGACHCGTITIEGEADPEKVTICHCTDCQTGTGSAFRVSVPIPGNVFKMKGTADQLREDHGRQRQSARAGVLPEVRLADLFDHAGRRPAGVLHGAGRHPDAARPARAEAAELVPLGAELGDQHGRHSEEPEAAGVSFVIRDRAQRAPRIRPDANAAPFRDRPSRASDDDGESSRSLIAAIDNLHWINPAAAATMAARPVRSPP